MTGGPVGDPAERRPLGDTAFSVSALGVGCSRLGAFWQHRGLTEGVQAIRAALDSGLTYIDTADCYSRGISERLIGKALRAHGGQDVVVSTKVGLLKTPLARASARRLGSGPDERRQVPEGAGTPTGRTTPRQCFEADYVQRAALRCLKRLGRERVEVLLLHEPSADALRRAAFLPAVEGLISAGRIGAFGVCCTTLEAAQAALELPGLALLQVPYNVRRPDVVAGVQGVAARRHVGLVALAVLGDGALLRGLPPGKVDLVLRACLRDALAHPAFSSVLLGLSTPEHVRRAVQAARVPLTEAEVREAEQLLMGRSSSREAGA